MIIQDIPFLTRSLISEDKTLTGLFFCDENIRLAGNIWVVKNSHIFLKDSMPHKESGPAIIQPNPTQEICNIRLNYFIHGSRIINKPFSHQGRSFPNHPATIHLLSLPTWNGSQFIYDPKDIVRYAFLNEEGMFHNETGPATVNIKDQIDESYFLNGEHLIEAQFNEEILKMRNKQAILEIIKNA